MSEILLKKQIKELEQQVRDLKKANTQLRTRIAQKEHEIEEIAAFIFGVLQALGVKSFDDLDKIGSTLLKAIPEIGMLAAIKPHKLKERFSIFETGVILLENYKHLIPEA